MSSGFQNGNLPSHYARLLESLGPDHPLRRTVLSLDDSAPQPGELADPLGEEEHTLCRGLIHTYPDKVLLLATLDCAVRCRYCTRGRLINNMDCAGLPALCSTELAPAATENEASHGEQSGGKPPHSKGFSNDWKPLPGDTDHFSNHWKFSDEIFQTLEKLTAVRDVLVSGGDPLMCSDEELDELFSRVWKIEHIRTVRLGSKIPAVMPERITPELACILSKHRIWLQLHFTHSAELTEETCRALDRLAEAGVPMVSQTVLLNGVNDDAATLTDLFYGLLQNRVKPYYLFQCDPVLGSASFRTPVQKGLDLMKELQGRVSGLALPNFCIDAPGGGGKIVLHPNTVLRREGACVLLTGFDGQVYRYPDARG